MCSYSRLKQQQKQQTEVAWRGQGFEAPSTLDATREVTSINGARFHLCAWCCIACCLACSVYRAVPANLLRFSHRVQCGWGLKLLRFSLKHLPFCRHGWSRRFCGRRSPRRHLGLKCREKRKLASSGCVPTTQHRLSEIHRNVNLAVFFKWKLLKSVNC